MNWLEKIMAEPWDIA